MSSLAKSALWVTFSEIIFNLSGFIIHTVLGRILEPANYGRYGLVVTLTTMVIVLIGNGIPTAMAKYISEFFETNPKMVLKIKRQAIILQTIIIGSITLIFYFSAGLIAGALGDPTLAPLFRFSTLIIPTFAAASFYFSFFTGLHQFNIQATLKTLRSVLRIGFVITLAIFFGLYGSISGYVLYPFVIFAAAFLIDKLLITRKLKKEALASKEQEIPFHWKKLVNYGWQIILFFLTYELLISIDLYMVKALLKDDALTGVYNASLTVGRIPYYIFYAMTVFLLPMVSRKSAGNNLKNAKEIINHALRIMLILLTPMVVLMSVYSQEILQLLYGKKYLAGAVPMSVLVFGVGFLTVFYVLSFAMNGAGQTKKAMFISFFGLIINVILNYFFILRFGILGSAWATTLASFAVMLMVLFFIKKDFDANFELREFFKVVMAGAITYALASFLPSGKFIFMPIGLAVFGTNLAILYALRGITKKDVQYFTSLLKKKKGREVAPEIS